MITGTKSLSIMALIAIDAVMATTTQGGVFSQVNTYQDYEDEDMGDEGSCLYLGEDGNCLMYTEDGEYCTEDGCTIIDFDALYGTDGDYCEEDGCAIDLDAIDEEECLECDLEPVDDLEEDDDDDEDDEEDDEEEIDELNLVIDAEAKNIAESGYDSQHG